ncbi:MAG: helix-turn-helix domain-containing protein [Planctomycetota bacterium]
MKLELLTIDEVADILRENRETTRQRVKSGQIEGVPMGRGSGARQKWLVPQENVERFLKEKIDAAYEPKQKPKRKAATASSSKEWF